MKRTTCSLGLSISITLGLGIGAFTVLGIGILLVLLVIVIVVVIGNSIVNIVLIVLHVLLVITTLVFILIPTLDDLVMASPPPRIPRPLPSPGECGRAVRKGPRRTPLEHTPSLYVAYMRYAI